MIDEMLNKSKKDKAIDIVQNSYYTESQAGQPAMLLGDVKELIETLTDTKIDINDLAIHNPPAKPRNIDTNIISTIANRVSEGYHIEFTACSNPNAHMRMNISKGNDNKVISTQINPRELDNLSEHIGLDAMIYSINNGIKLYDESIGKS